MQRMKHVYRIIAFILILIISLFICSKLFVHTSSHNEMRIRNFFLQEKNSIDVVFIGASEIFTGISPMQIWNDYGITSYNLAASGLTMNMTKNMLKETLTRQNPKLIVVSLNGCIYDDRKSREGMERFWIDNVPFSINKIRTIDEINYKEDKLQFYFPLSKYHSNYNKMDENISLTLLQLNNFFKRENLISQTSYLSSGVYSGNDKIIYAEDFSDKSNMYPDAEEDLKELLDYCDENNLKDRIAFVNMPAYYNESLIENKMRVNSGIEMVKNREYRVYDLDNFKTEIGLKLVNDYYNTGHPNVFGQEKITKYFFEMLNNEYKIKGQYSKTIIDRWNDDYKMFEKLKNRAKKTYNSIRPGKDFVYTFEAIEHIEDNTIDKYEKEVLG